MPICMGQRYHSKVTTLGFSVRHILRFFVLNFIMIQNRNVPAWHHGEKTLKMYKKIYEMNFNT